MATRNFPMSPQSNILKLVTLCVSLNGGGAGNAPTLGVGDPNATFFTQPVRTSAGVFSFTTVDAYPAIASAQFSFAGAGSATSDVFESPVATQNANNTWTFTLTTYVSGTLADIPTTAKIRCIISMQNTGDPYAG